MSEPTYFYAVVVGVPEPDDFGNLATAIGTLYVDPQANGGEYTDPRQRLGEWLGNPTVELYVQTPVFVLGEILILDGDGREPVGRGRKPGKWSVEIDTYETLGAAIERALEVQQRG